MDRRSDVFSLGVVTWELLTGQGLFEGDSIYAIALAVEQQELVPPSRVLGSPLPTGLDAAVMAALTRDPDQRTPTAAAFAEALDGVVQASGGESLAAWAERELEGKRSEHRAWLANVVGGTTLPRASGRASGQHTEVGGAAPVGDAAVVKPPGGSVDPIAETSLGPVDGEPVVRRRALAPIVVVLLALLLTSIAIWLATVGRHHDEPVATNKPPRDAAVKAIAMEPPDAAVIPIDAADVVIAVPADAPTTPTRHHGHRDAGVIAAVVPADAAPVGSGVVSIRFKPGVYANISVDFGNGESPPINHRKLAAGHHVIRFLDPTQGTVLDTQQIDLVDGQKLVVIQR